MPNIKVIPAHPSTPENNDRRDLPRANVWSVTPFERIVGNFAREGAPGIHDETDGDGRCVIHGPFGRVPARILHLVYRDTRGRVVGHLAYYPEGVFGFYNPGEYSMTVWSGIRRRGVGTALVAEADRRWGLDFTRQNYTDAGRALVVKYLNERDRLALSELAPAPLMGAL